MEATVDPPSRGSRLDADHPLNGVLIPRRFTDFAPSVRQARESALQALALDSENAQAEYVLAQTSHWAGEVRAA